MDAHACHPKRKEEKEGNFGHHVDLQLCVENYNLP
jgi:hypothetical protein